MPPVKRKYVQSSTSTDNSVACDYCHVRFQPRGIKSHQAHCGRRPEKVKRREEFVDAADKVVQAQLVQGASGIPLINIRFTLTICYDQRASHRETSSTQNAQASY